MFKGTYTAPSYEKAFIRQALLSGLRLDGRGLGDTRPLAVQLSRGECRSTAEVTLGGAATRVIATVTGVIVTPFPDRPTEGTIQFSADLSVESANQNGGTGEGGNATASAAEICRLLERSIKDSDAIDLESLCILAGDKVWSISCEVCVIDCSGGNLVDCCLFAAMSALRAFRKPEVAVTSIGSGEFSGRNLTQVRVFRADEREPLQLALHHVPLSVSLAIFKLIPHTDAPPASSTGDDQGSSSSSSSSSSKERRQSINLKLDDNANVVQSPDGRQVYTALVCDPSREEESVMDGSMVISLNAHREICAVHKPGKVAVSPAVIVQAAKLAAARVQLLHATLANALSELEKQVAIANADKLERLRKYNSQFPSAI